MIVGPQKLLRLINKSSLLSFSPYLSKPSQKMAFLVNNNSCAYHMYYLMNSKS